LGAGCGEGDCEYCLQYGVVFCHDLFFCKDSKNLRMSCMKRLVRRVIIEQQFWMILY
jgi:hypothetical protein